MLKQWTQIIWAVGSLCILAQVAPAGPVTYEFAGTVTASYGLYESVPVGASITGTYTFDLAAGMPSLDSGTIGSQTASFIVEADSGNRPGYPAPDTRYVFSSTAKVGSVSYKTNPALAQDFALTSSVEGFFVSGGASEYLVGESSLDQNNFGSQSQLALQGDFSSVSIPWTTAGLPKALALANSRGSFLYSPALGQPDGGQTGEISYNITSLKLSASAPAVPTFSPIQGSYSATQKVSILDSTSDVTLFYTTNGTAPTTNSLRYSTPIIVAASETIKVIAVGSNDAESGVAEAAYTILPPISVLPTALTFLPTAVGAASISQIISVKNNRTAAIALSDISLTGIYSDDYAISKTCASTLVAGASCTISVTFKPIAAGAKPAKVQISDNATGSPQLVSLTGTGTAAKTTPAVKLSATSVIFGNEPVGIASAVKSITLTNSGNASLNIASIALSGAQADDFALSKTCGTALAAGKACTISVTFKPIAAGTKSANIKIADNASGSPQDVSLSGKGT